MITEKEKAFLQYWEQHREQFNTFSSKLSRGIPMAILFALPIILLVVVVWIFFPDWYMKISKTSPGMFVTAIFAMFGVVVFYAYFRMQFKWEMNEQLYQELKIKQNNTKPVDETTDNH